MLRRQIDSFFQRVLQILNGNLKTINGQSVVGSGNITVSGSASWGGITGTLSSQTDLQTALNNKENLITAGTTSQYFRGDKTFQTLDKSAVGLGSVDNTDDLSKPVSTLQAAAIALKQDTLVSGTNIKTVNTNSLLGSGNISVQDVLVSGTNIKTLNTNTILGSGDITIDKTFIGLSNVDNTSDLNKPISTATQTALNAKQDSLILTTTGTSGAATLVGSTLNIPQYSGGGGGGGAVTVIEMGFSGTTVTGTTTNTITKTILLPANTFAINNGIEIIASFGINGTTGGVNARLYLNTTPSLTGATLVNTFYSVAGGSVMNNHMNYRFFMFDGTNMRTFFAQNTGVVSNIFQSVAAANNVAYNLANDYYLIFAIQNGNVANSSVINGYRVLKYA